MVFRIINKAVTDLVKEGLTTEEALQAVRNKEQNNLSDAEEIMNGINEAYKGKFSGIEKIEDPTERETRSRTQKQAREIMDSLVMDFQNLENALRDKYPNDSFDRVIQRMAKPKGCPGADDFNNRIVEACHIPSGGSTNANAEQKANYDLLYTEILAEYSKIDYEDFFKPRTDEELVKFLSVPENQWHFNLLMESQNHITEGYIPKVNSELNDMRESVGKAHLNSATAMMMRLGMLEQAEYADYTIERIAELKDTSYMDELDEVGEKLVPTDPNSFTPAKAMFCNIYDYATSGHALELDQALGAFSNGYYDSSQGELLSMPMGKKLVIQDAASEMEAGRNIVYHNKEDDTYYAFSLDEKRALNIGKVDYKPVTDPPKYDGKEPRMPFPGKVIGAFLNSLAHLVGAEFLPYAEYRDKKTMYDNLQKAKDCPKENVTKFEKTKGEYRAKLVPQKNADTFVNEKKLAVEAVKSNGDIAESLENPKMFEDDGIVKLGSQGRITNKSGRDLSEEEASTVKYFDERAEQIQKSRIPKDSQFNELTALASESYQRLGKYVEVGEINGAVTNNIGQSMKILAAYNTVYQERMQNNPNYPNVSKDNLVVGENEKAMMEVGIKDFADSFGKVENIRELAKADVNGLVKFAKGKHDKKLPNETMNSLNSEKGQKKEQVRTNAREREAERPKEKSVI